MTESEWLECTDPTPMLEFLRGKASDRKLRLFAVSCCRRIWQMVTDERLHKAIEVLAEFADGQTYEEQLGSAAEAAEAVEDDAFTTGAHVTEEAACAVRAAIYDKLVETASYAARAIACNAGDYGSPAWETVKEGETVAQCGLLNDIFGNPFRPLTIDSAWLTPTVTTLATAAYEERILPSGQLDPARLAVLSDALEEAGCDHADILSHLRSPGPHVRGCWVVDLLLGKE